MNITVHVTAAELRSTPFPEYEPVLHNLIGEGHTDADDIEIVLVAGSGVQAKVLIDGSADSDEARDILNMTQEITQPEVKDGYFG